MNFDLDRNLIWIIGFALVIFALSNKGAFPGSFLGLQPVNNELVQELGPEPGYIYRSRRIKREHRCL